MVAAGKGGTIAASGLVVLALLASAPAGRSCAQSRAVSVLARYQAPADCPGQPELERRLVARVRHPELLGQETQLAVQIERQAGRARGVIAFASGAQARSIDAVSCGELVEALSLIGALMLEPMLEGRPRTDEQRTPHPAVPPKARTTTGARDGVRKDERVAAPPQAARVVDEPALPSRSEEPAQLPPPAPATPGTARLPRELPRHELSLTASALLATGLVPHAQVGFALATEYQLVRGQAGLLLRGGVRLLLPDTIRLEAGDVTFRWWSYAASLCATRSGRVFDFGGCGALELGQLRAAGSNTDNPRATSRLWSALGPAALARLHLAGPWFAQLGAELLFALARHRYLLAENSVYSVPWLTFRGELAIGVEFW